ncbi:MAG: molybdopterin-dependent oxidoreductase, partial [Burkholderiales bacterium]|nr:molybdopterin-dependent oxidoreductase [Burkholderiales bacterium]
MLTEMATTEAGGDDGAAGAMNRRVFLKWSGVVGGSLALVSTAAKVALSPSESEAAEPTDIVWSACTVNCGSRCPLRLEVKDGTIVRVLGDDTGSDVLGDQQVRACVRGRSIRHRISNPDRLKKPMKRKAGTKRGDEQWETISWEQALDEIAEKMTDIKSRFGN